MPVSPSGKLERRELPPPSTEATRDAAAKRPMLPMERAVARVWSEVLGLDDTLLSHDSDFVAMGAPAPPRICLLQNFL